TRERESVSRGRRIRIDRRCVGVRQDHAPKDGGGAGAAGPGRSVHGRRTDERLSGPRFHRVSELFSAALAECDGERTARRRKRLSGVAGGSPERTGLAISAISWSGRGAG